MKQVRSRYSKEFKIKAVELSIERGNIQSVADELNVYVETLRLWRKAYKEGKLILSEEDKVGKQKSKEELELAKLRKELYEVKLERDILKKAVGIFSKNDR
jgi:transposase